MLKALVAILAIATGGPTDLGRENRAARGLQRLQPPQQGTCSYLTAVLPITLRRDVDHEQKVVRSGKALRTYFDPSRVLPLATN